MVDPCWSQDLQPKMLKFHWYWSPNCAQFRSLHSSGSNSPVLRPCYSRLFAGANLHPSHQCPHAWPGGDWPTSLCASVCTGWQGVGRCMVVISHSYWKWHKMAIYSGFTHWKWWFTRRFFGVTVLELRDLLKTAWEGRWKMCPLARKVALPNTLRWPPRPAVHIRSKKR